MPAPKDVPQERRDHVIPPVRVTAAERDLIRERCAQSGLSLSAYVRQLALEGAVIERESLADRELIQALARVGNNLNQLARQANIHGEIDDEMEQRLEGPLVRIEQLIDELTS